MAAPAPTFRFADRNGATVLQVGGAWTVLGLRSLVRDLEQQRKFKRSRPAGVIDASAVEQLDTAGALEILQIAGAGKDVAIQAADKAQADLFRVVQQNLRPVPPERQVDWFGHWLSEVGHSLIYFQKQIVNLCAFFGEILVVFAEACLKPRRFRVNAIVQQMYEVWVKALAIVGVLCFLIGVVIAYQGVQQLRQFGAETFTVEAVGIAMFRELGVLLTAIIVAGRSGSAFTAQIGTMQVNQEIDAMNTIGLNPIEWLVLPRILALLFAMPLLAFWGDMTGLLGGAFACTIYLDFTFAQFFERLRDAVGAWHFYTGMIKSPVFGIVIAAIGCFEGLQVKGSAESVGQLTTRSVVEAIFCVIVLDAIFSIIFLLANV